MIYQKFLKVLTILIMLNLCGCSRVRPININVIEKEDFLFVEAGAKLEKKDKVIIPLKKDGFYLTKNVMARIKDARINQIK